MNRPALHLLTAAAAGVTAAAAVLAAALMVANGSAPAALVAGHDLVGVLVAVSFGAVGAVVLWRRPAHALGWVFLTVGLLEALAAFGAAYAARRPAPPLAGLAGMVGERIWFPGGVLALALVIPLFPDGLPASPRRRALVRAGFLVSAAGFVATWLLDPPQPPYPAWDVPLRLPASDAVATALQLAALACGLLGGAALLGRLRRATPAERRRLGWFGVALLVGVLGQLLDPVSPVFPLVGWALFPAGLGVAMLRHGLFDGDRLLSRTLVSIVLAGAVAGLFGLAVGLGSTRAGGEGAGAVAAAVVVALGLAPARVLVQRGVDRLLYGRDRDPYAALTRLGRQLSATIAPDEVLPVVVRAVADALRLPYAAVTLAGEAEPAATHGTRPATTVDLPLTHAGTGVGTLSVGPPSSRARLDPADEQLLHVFAEQIGPAAYGVRLTHDLRRSRDRTVRARDSERHRIRRDLHDGLGPTLAGVALGLGAARRAATTAASRDLLGTLEAEVRDSLEDVKRLVADLHPTALDLGLVAALHGYADTVTIRSEGALHVRVDAPDRLAAPAHVELVAYRIALEAVTNVARHARAADCTVCLSVVDDALLLEVRDDGVGIPDPPAPGVGLRSMAERAAEVGGTAVVTPGAGGGTVVRACLPLPRSGGGS
ncbi:sensor histidine kinase [Actinoplanes sp. URMC 104]|uniref:sensor histidine kinase n=1 Tax=Actinoplanes sp. URMC 104 TaxID=3423409 RepID=UPI003F1D17E9